MLKKALIVVLLLIHYNILACICIPVSLKKQWNYSSHIFIGKVINIQKYENIYLLGENNNNEYLLIKIEQSFKGFYTIPKYITLIKSNSSCERSYIKNNVYIFYCSTFMGTELMYAPNSCSRTIDANNPDYTNEILELTKLKNTESPPKNSAAFLTIGQDELENLKNDAVISDELLQKNKVLKITTICLASLLLIGLVIFLYQKTQNSKAT